MTAPPATIRLRCITGLLLVVMGLVCISLPVGADGEPWRLGVDDVVSVHVLHQPDFSVNEATVRPDGRINVPVAGEVVVAGRTVEEVAAQIEDALREELREPRVSVRLVRRHVKPIYVLGAVRAPGAVEVREPVTVAEAIALAQGLSDTAAPRQAVLIDEAGGGRRIDVLKALHRPEGGGTVRIRPGETLLVSAQFLVTVVGQVGVSGRYPAEEGDRVADALAAAGGLSEDAAEAGSVVRADGETVELDLEALLDRGEEGSNVALLPGDMIVVPRARRRVALVGALNQSGKYDFDPGDRVSDALALGGDVAEDALPRSAMLLRQDGTSRRVDVEALLQASEGAENPELRDGDTLVLPRATDRIAVVGMVASPGPLLLEPEMTVMDAIAAAGGWEAEKAHPERTILWRQTTDGVEMAHVNARKLLRGEEGVDNPVLAAGDIVFVPRDASITLDEVARLLLGVSGLLRVAF
ncbi:MAG: SLBB domain-containing protein [Armatimonadota bacterium]